MSGIPAGKEKDFRSGCMIEWSTLEKDMGKFNHMMEVPKGIMVL